MRPLSWLVRGAIGLVVLAVVGWGALALHFAGPRPAALSDALAVAWVLVMIAISLAVRPAGRKLLALTAAFAALLVWWSTIRPSNDRDWLPDVARPPFATRDGDLLTIHNLRNFDYRSETDYTPVWETRTYDLSQLTGIDLFLSYWGSPMIAHTILSWSFADGQHLAISIETRKERGETYSAIAGFFKQYELYYVVADERDLIGLRTNQRGEDVYLYPLSVPVDQARRVLLDYVAGFNELAQTPRFYGAATQNCTTTIRTHLVHIGEARPWDWRILVNGYADQMLYERGTIDTSRPFAEVKASSLINSRAKAADDHPDFSQRIRQGLIRPSPAP